MRDERFERASADEGWLARAREWLKSNPPPEGWQGSDLEWAYLEMPGVPWFLASWAS